LNQVEEQLLAANGLSEQDVYDGLSILLEHQVDYADLYFQGSFHESWVMEDGIIKDGSYNIEQGVGVRGVHGEKTGLSYSDQVNLDAIIEAAKTARSITGKLSSSGAVAKGQRHGKQQVFSKFPQRKIIMPAQPLEAMSNDEKVDLLRSVDSYIREQSPLATNIVVSMSGVYEQVLVAASDGTWATDIRPLIRLNCSIVLEKNGRKERGGAGAGGRTDYGHFLEMVDGKLRYQTIADEAIHMATVNLEAVDAPAGTMPVVLGSGWPGVLLHEAVGHGLEGDFNRKGSSNYSGKIGENVASELCTIVDDGTLGGLRGSLNIDDEGVPSQYNVLIENGVLKSYMQDKMNARLMDVPVTGNGRRESFAHMPMPRMTNTYMLPGESTPVEIIESVDYGIYATNFAGGQVDITSGKFVFSASEAYLIENGKITKPVKGATLIGNGPDAMGQVSMVGNDLALDRGIGVCGKDGQSVPVGVGQPTLKLDAITVGGTN
jgi:TldD protein